MFFEKDPVGALLARRERDFGLATVNVVMNSALENLDLGDYRLDGLKIGDRVEVPRWIARELSRLGLATPTEEQVDGELLKSLSREKMMGPLQLSKLQSDFYPRVRARLEDMKEDVKAGKMKGPDYDRFRAACYDLIGIRLSKLLAVSNSSTPLASFGDKVTPEEAEFFAQAKAMSSSWREAILGGGA